MISALLTPMMLAAPCDRPRSASEASMELNRVAMRVAAYVRSSMTFGEPWKVAVSHLQELWMECSSANWDGYGAPALSQDVFYCALQFVQTIPFDIPQPEIGASSSGDITFEWAQTPRRVVSVGVSPNGEVHYASLNGNSRHYGSLPLDGTFDPHLRSLIVSVLG